MAKDVMAVPCRAYAIAGNSDGRWKWQCCRQYDSGNQMANLPYNIGANPTYQAVLVMLDAFTAVAKGENMLTLVGGGTSSSVRLT
jgi:hypothetical protein